MPVKIDETKMTTAMKIWEETPMAALPV